jgi:hypothetical protein
MSKIDFAEKAGPSLACAVDVCAGLPCTEALVVLLNRREPQAAPHYVQFDPYRRRYRRGRLRWGNRGPLQRLKRRLVARRFRRHEAMVNQLWAESAPARPRRRVAESELQPA